MVFQMTVITMLRRGVKGVCMMNMGVGIPCGRQLASPAWQSVHQWQWQRL
jgi:hypothetical protein